MGDILNGETFQNINAWLKLGVYDYDSIPDLLAYMLPEILIMTFIMLNEIHLKLIGLYYKIEDDIETVTEGIQRFIERGDEEKLEQKKLAAANMQMSKYFVPKEIQQKSLKIELEEENRELLSL